MYQTDSPNVRAVFLDLDGLLINTEDLYISALQSLLTERLCPLMPEHLAERTIGHVVKFEIEGVKEWLEENAVGDGKEWVTVVEFARDLEERFRRIRNKAILNDGAGDLIRTLFVYAFAVARDGHLDCDKMEAVIVSNTTNARFAVKCACHDVFNLVPDDRKLCRDDPRLASYERRPKPAPDLFLAALDILNKERTIQGQMEIHPAECLVFEDSTIGLEAARRAGMRVVWVPHRLTRNAYRGGKWKALSGGLKEEGGRGDAEEMVEVRDSLLGFEYEKYGITIGTEGLLAN